MNLHACVRSVSLIVQLRAGVQIGTASGFFYKRDGRLFLATNAHVCQDASKGSYPDTLRLKLHVHASDLTRNADYDVPLYSGGTPLWRTPPGRRTADVALLSLDLAAMMALGFHITHWEPPSLLPTTYALNPGEDVFLMGYPHGVHDTVNNLPVFRNAMIASTYPVEFQGQPFFLTDGNFQPGMSGSPVLSKPKNVWTDHQGNSFFDAGSIYYLLGVHSGTVETGNIPLGLGAAWYAKLVDETATSFVQQP